MNRRSFLLRLLFCAGLVALAAPLRAGAPAWISSAGHNHTLQLPAGWVSGAAVRGLGPKKIPHAFSLMPASRAYTLDIAAENALDPASGSTEDYFARALKLAGSPAAVRIQLPDYSMFEHFSSSAVVKGRPICRVQGVLHKYVQRYYLTFSSARGCPAGKDLKEALQVIATLDPVEPGAGGWKNDFMQKLAGAGIGAGAANSGDFRFSSASRPDGTPVSFEDIAVFGCKNFVGNLYLFNENRTAHCWITTMADYRALLPQLDQRYWRDIFASYPNCPMTMRQERACDIAKLRNFF